MDNEHHYYSPPLLPTELPTVILTFIASQDNCISSSGTKMYILEGSWSRNSFNVSIALADCSTLQMMKVLLEYCRGHFNKFRIIPMLNAIICFYVCKQKELITGDAPVA